jgi:thymidylate synthase (FAD)
MPQTFLIGSTTLEQQGINDYLAATEQQDFHARMAEALVEGVSYLEIISSFYAKLCYSALTAEKNENISKVRGIAANVRGTLAQGHGSVFEHVTLNFVTTGCSRVFTHEMVRHRVGTAYSQTSGRYVRTDKLEVVHDPILDKVRDDADMLLAITKTMYDKMRCQMGVCSQEELDAARDHAKHDDRDRYPLEPLTDMTTKKKITSALRRYLPNGQANELGWSANIRTLRHLLMIRTSRHAEWEIRLIFNQVWDLVQEKCPGFFHDAKTEEVDGLLEITGMRTQPYEA